jgi:hypothetical protein
MYSSQYGYGRSLMGPSRIKTYLPLGVDWAVHLALTYINISFCLRARTQDLTLALSL